MASKNNHPPGIPEADPSHPSSLLAAYALHALSPQEEAVVEEYLATYPDASDDVMMLQEAAAMIPYSVPSQTPSPQLRLRLMADVYQEALADAGERPRTPQPVSLDAARSRRQRGIIWPFAAVILLVLTLGFGGWAAALNHDLGGKERVIATQSSAIAAVGMTKPIAGTSPNVPARGELLRLANDQAAVLTINGLPLLASGKVYEVWFIAGNTPVGAGLFSPNSDGSWSGLVRGDVTNAQAIAISVEPTGGSAAPTGDIVAKGSL
ncbi:MAG: anti-sigma factor [Chloroflexota bacterium]|nr:anti-sigma factor [Chloroflexota bacterium]MDQ6907809.1 anti-sigma factor [Chloroflexota bacterium]